jgi:uncharacterized protein
VITRRRLLQGAGAFTLGVTSFAGYAFAVEPYRLMVTRYKVRPRNWPTGLKLSIAVVADLHVSEPWMPPSRVRSIVEATNRLGADLIVMLGDFVGGYQFTHRFGKPVPKALWTPILADLKAPLGRYAVLGNHDWWEHMSVQRRRSGPTEIGEALKAAGIPVFENDAVRLEKDGHGFWLCGLGDQWAFAGRDRHVSGDRFDFNGVDDLPGTLAKVTDDAPVVMMVHEPDVFATMPERVALTMAGHTHGGQVQLFGYAPIVPSRYGMRYVYGHIRERDRDMIVSSGLGCSGLPVRFGRPPEIVRIEIEA